MTKAIRFWCLAIAILISAPAANAQQPKIPKIGYLGVRPAASDPAPEEFAREFRALGYVKGRNVLFEYRTADDQLDRLPVLADELVRLKVDVLVAATTPVLSPPRTLPGRSPSFFMAALIRLRSGWLTAWHGLGATSQDSPRLRRHWLGNGWSY